MHVKVDHHFIPEKVTEKKIQLEYAGTRDQVANFLTRAISERYLSDVLSMLGIINIHGTA